MTIPDLVVNSLHQMQKLILLLQFPVSIIYISNEYIIAIIPYIMHHGNLCKMML